MRKETDNLWKLNDSNDLIIMIDFAHYAGTKNLS